MMSLLKKVINVTTGIGISRVLGYIRDVITAMRFGAGVQADAFYAAFRIPNLFRRMLGEGALSASFVPVFNTYLQKSSKKETQEFVNICFTALLVVLVLLVLCGMIFAKPFTGLITYGFTKEALKYELTANLTRILFPFLLFVSLAAFTMSILVSLNIFFLPSSSSGLISCSEIFYLIFLLPLFLDPNYQIYGLAVSVVIGSFLQTFSHFVAIYKAGYKPRLNFNFVHPGLKEVTLLLTPVLLSFSIEQINMFVDTICASFLELGSMTALYYSNRLVLLPLALFGTSAAIVNLPTVSKYVVENNIEKLKETLESLIRLSSFIIIPASAGLMFLGLPIIKMLFERGVFTEHASRLTYSALFFYSIGLFSFANIKILLSLFYAMKIPKIPVKISGMCMILNAILNIILMQFLGVGGLALATSISSITNMSLLLKNLKKKISNFEDKKIIFYMMKVALLSIIVGIITFIMFNKMSNVNLTLKTFLCIFFYVILYFFISLKLKFKEAKSVISLLPFRIPILE